jgi:hypothetical protein
MNDLAKLLTISGEIKFEKMITIPKEQMLCLLQNSEAKYVIVGIQKT